MRTKKSCGWARLSVLVPAILVVVFCIMIEARAAEYEEVYITYGGKKTELTKGDYSYEFYSVEKKGKTVGVLEIYDKNKTELLDKISGDMYSAYIGEEKIYYVLKGKLYELKLSSGEKRKLKLGDKTVYMGAVKGDDIYIFRYTKDDFIRDLYRIDLKTGKETKLIKDCSTISLGDKYIAYAPSAGDVGPRVLSICDYSGKNKKTVAALAQSFAFVGDKLYYGAYNSMEDAELTIYSYDVNTGKRSIATKKKIEGYPNKYTDSYLEFFYWESPDVYRLDYASGKITRVKE